MPSDATPDAPMHPKRTGPPDEALGPDEEGAEFQLDKPLPCVHCGHLMEVARVVRLEAGRYAYACLGCAVATGGRASQGQ